MNYWNDRFEEEKKGKKTKKKKGKEEEKENVEQERLVVRSFPMTMSSGN